jgi:hypothetical protein
VQGNNFLFATPRGLHGCSLAAQRVTSIQSQTEAWAS